MQLPRAARCRFIQLNNLTIIQLGNFLIMNVELRIQNYEFMFREENKDFRLLKAGTEIPEGSTERKSLFALKKQA